MEGTEPAVWIQGWQKSRLNKIGISTVTKETLNTHGLINTLKSVSPQAAVLGPSNARTIIPFGWLENIDSDFLQRHSRTNIQGRPIVNVYSVDYHPSTLDNNVKWLNISRSFWCKLILSESNGNCSNNLFHYIFDVFPYNSLRTWIHLRFLKEHPNALPMIITKRIYKSTLATFPITRKLSTCSSSKFYRLFHPH